MGRIKGFFSGINQRLKGFPKGRQGKAFLRVLQFFAIMVVLTIFARGVASVTMPEVELTRLSQQTIRKEERFSGAITASNKTDINPPAGLKVASVHVSIGDNVREGDDLVSFDTVALDEELLNQRSALLALQQQLRALQESSSPDDSAIKMAEALRDTAQKNVNTMTSARNLAKSAADDAAAAVTAAEQSLAALEGAKANDLTNWLEYVNNKVGTAMAAVTATSDAYFGTGYSVDTPNPSSPLGIFEALEREYAVLSDPTLNPPTDQATLDDVKTRMDAAEVTKNSAKSNYEAALATLTEAYNFGGHVDGNGTFQAVEATAKSNIEALYNAQIPGAQAAVTDAKTSAALTQAGLETAIENLDTANTTLAEAQESLDKAVENYNKAQSDAVLAEQIRQNNIRLKRLEVEAQQKTVDTVAALQSAGGALKATQDGTVSNLTLVSGAITTETDLVQLSTGSEGLLVEFQVTQTQMREIQMGDAVSVLRENYYYPTEARVIGRGLPDENGYITVRAQLQSYDFNDGDRVSVTVIISDTNYWNCVPVSAVRPDANGSYVLVLAERSTVLGMQTVAQKMSVTVLDQNSDYAAIEGLYDNTARIVLSSSKPINDGDMVRIAEGSSR